MKNFEQLLTEVNFKQYKAIVMFRFNTDPKYHMGSEKLSEMIRALPGATRVSTASLDKDKGIAIMNTRLISQKPPKDAFISLKKNALSRYGNSILDVKVGAGTIETKDFVK